METINLVLKNLIALAKAAGEDAPQLLIFEEMDRGNELMVHKITLEQAAILLKKEQFDYDDILGMGSDIIELDRMVGGCVIFDHTDQVTIEHSRSTTKMSRGTEITRTTTTRMVIKD